MDKSRIEPTIFLIEKISFSLKLFSGHFYGQSFIKTVRGPSISGRGKAGVITRNVNIMLNWSTFCITSFWIVIALSLSLTHTHTHNADPRIC